MKNLLLAIDFEEHAAKLLKVTESLALGLTDAKVWLVHVSAPDPDFVGMDAGPQVVRENRAAELHGEHRRLQEWTRQMKKKGIEAESLLIQGPTVETLLAKQAELGIDMLIMGSHSHSWLFKALIGSTRDALMREQDIPTLLVPLD